MNLRKYLKESCKYMLRSYPIIRPYVKEVEGLFTMSQEELNKRNEQRFWKFLVRLMINHRFIINYIQKQE